MARIKWLALPLLLAPLALILSACSSNGNEVSFTIDVPTGTTAYATLQANDGHILQTAAVDAGTKLVSFANAPGDSLVTVSM